MKKFGKFGCLVAVMLLMAVISLSVVSGLGNQQPALSVVPEAAPAAENLALESNNALDARLGQLLNLNRVYDCLDSTVALIDEASVILLDQAEVIDGNQVLPVGKVLSFIHDLYGVKLDLSDLPTAYTATADGYFDIIPRGYNSMDSRLVNTEIQPDGSIKANAVLTLTDPTGKVVNVNTETVFVANAASAFGYNIVNATITETADADGEAVEGYNIQNPMDLLDGEYDAISLA